MITFKLDWFTRADGMYATLWQPQGLTSVLQGGHLKFYWTDLPCISTDAMAGHPH